MRIKRSAVIAPKLPEELVPVEGLGGDVLVRGLGLSARMDLAQKFKDKQDPASRNFGHLAPLLAVSVLDAEDEPLFSAAEWEAWGVLNNAEFMKLWDIAWRLSDMDGAEAAKNSKAPTSD